MKTLWAPWRMSYISGQEGRDKECIFDFEPDTSSDKMELLLYRDHHVLVMLNRFPYANGHLLAAPTRHIADLADLTVHEQSALMSIICQSSSILRHHLNPEGLNIGLNMGSTAGAGLADHLHFHIVPRWQGDHNFMTVLADIRVIPQHIAETYDLLSPAFMALQI